jgi:hypothetical protein
VDHSVQAAQEHARDGVQISTKEVVRQLKELHPRNSARQLKSLVFANIKKKLKLKPRDS